MSPFFMTIHIWSTYAHISFQLNFQNAQIFLCQHGDTMNYLESLFSHETGNLKKKKKNVSFNIQGHSYSKPYIFFFFFFRKLSKKTNKIIKIKQLA